MDGAPDASPADSVKEKEQATSLPPPGPVAAAAAAAKKCQYMIVYVNGHEVSVGVYKGDSFNTLACILEEKGFKVNMVYPDFRVGSQDGGKQIPMAEIDPKKKYYISKLAWIFPHMFSYPP